MVGEIWISEGYDYEEWHLQLIRAAWFSRTDVREQRAVSA